MPAPQLPVKHIPIVLTIAGYILWLAGFLGLTYLFEQLNSDILEGTAKHVNSIKQAIDQVTPFAIFAPPCIIILVWRNFRNIWILLFMVLAIAAFWKSQHDFVVYLKRAINATMQVRGEFDMLYPNEAALGDAVYFLLCFWPTYSCLIAATCIATAHRRNRDIANAP